MSDNRRRFMNDAFYHRRVRIIARAILDTLPDDEALSVILAVLGGAEIRKEIVESFLRDDKHCEWRVIEKQDPPCSTCGGDGEVMDDCGDPDCTDGRINIEGPGWKTSWGCPVCVNRQPEPCPTCGTGEEE